MARVARPKPRQGAPTTRRPPPPQPRQGHRLTRLGAIEQGILTALRPHTGTLVECRQVYTYLRKKHIGHEKKWAGAIRSCLRKGWIVAAALATPQDNRGPIPCRPGIDIGHWWATDFVGAPSLESGWGSPGTLPPPGTRLDFLGITRAGNTKLAQALGLLPQRPGKQRSNRRTNRE